MEKRYGRRRIVEHLGSAHTQAELAVVLEIGREKLSVGQPVLDFEDEPVGRPRGGGAVVEGQSSRLLVEVIRASWERLGFDRIQDEAFFQLVMARLVEPTSKLDSLQVIEELGIRPVHLSTVKRALQRCVGQGYREQLAAACFEYVWNDQCRDVSLVLYDVTTLYFEALSRKMLCVRSATRRNAVLIHRSWSGCSLTAV